MTIGCFSPMFQPFSIKKQLSTWIVVWRFAPTERSVSNLDFLFISLLCCLLLQCWPWRYFFLFGETLLQK